MVRDGDTDGGLVSRDTISTEDARRFEAALTASGHQASWAPDADVSGRAWLYVVEAS